jgi:hypothetical protein
MIRPRTTSTAAMRRDNAASDACTFPSLIKRL